MTRPLVILSRILPFHGVGGMQAVAWDIARSLAAEGVRVTALTTRIPDRPERFVEDGVDVVAFAPARPGRYSRAWWRCSRTYLARESAEPAALLSVSAAAYGVLGRRRALRLAPAVLQAHGTAFGEVISKWRTGSPTLMVKSARNAAWVPVDLAMYRRFDAVVAVGEPVHADLTAAPVRWVLPPSHVHLIPNGVDTAVFSPDSVARARTRAARGWTDDMVVISTARLHAQKGVDRTLRGFRAFLSSEPRARLVVAGDGPERGRLGELARALGIAERVTFAGEVDRRTLPDLLRAADAFVLTTSHREGLPLSVLEALAVGTPVVVSRHLHAVLAVSPAVVGVDPADPADIARVLANLGAREARCLLPPAFRLEAATRQYRRLLEL